MFVLIIPIVFKRKHFFVKKIAHRLWQLIRTILEVKLYAVKAAC